MPGGLLRSIDPRGRASRRAFWLFTLKAWGVLALALLIGVLSGLPSAWLFIGLTVIAPPSLAILLRRLRDTGASPLLIPAFLVSLTGASGAAYVFAVIAAGGLEPQPLVTASALGGAVATALLALAILIRTLGRSRV